MFLLNRLTTLHKFQKPGILIILSTFLFCAHNTVYGNNIHPLRIIKLTCEYQQDPLLVASDTLISDGNCNRINRKQFNLPTP